MLSWVMTRQGALSRTHLLAPNQGPCPLRSPSCPNDRAHERQSRYQGGLGESLRSALRTLQLARLQASLRPGAQGDWFALAGGRLRRSMALR